MAILEVPRPSSGADAESPSVNLPRSDVTAAIERESSHAQAGMLAGVLIILVGALMIFGGITSTESAVVIQFGENQSFEMTSVLPGLFFAAAGVAVIWLTRPKIAWQTGNE